ncbi:MAG: pseudouridylate synthase [Tannerella sp.]|jgi:predicted hotdog family 3-hydroxylacyl-ACP dehydratase|nr:pseudouridylate synthase [Tannerella sp.]
MMSHKITDFDVTELLPQRPPFIMVDKLIHYDPLRVVTTFTVREDNLFCKNGVMEESGLIENIAQTCAAKTGYRDLTEPERDGVVKIGVIGMIKRMDIYRNPRVKEQLTTTADILEEVFNSTLVGAKVEIDGELIAICEMKIYLTDKAPDTLRANSSRKKE